MYILKSNLQSALQIAITHQQAQTTALGLSNTIFTAGLIEVLEALRRGETVEIK